ncbi:MAG: hypothetical protein IRY83_04400 [Chloroflexi bacterium]|nr:hypothetical protein [Chloroflexota bacterium]
MRCTIETGDIFFLYTARPSAARGPADVHELAVILSPDRDPPSRLLVVHGRQLPAPANGTPGPPVQATVIAVRQPTEELVSLLEGRVIHHGRRVVPRPARPCGEGRYLLTLHDGHTDLTYALELPATPGPVQHDLGLAAQATYRITIQPPPAAGLGAQPAAGFRPLTDTHWLNREGGEVRLEPVVEPDAPTVVRQPEGPATAEIFGELKLSRPAHPVEALYQGVWV